MQHTRRTLEPRTVWCGTIRCHPNRPKFTQLAIRNAHWDK